MLTELKDWFESRGFGSKEICRLDKTCCPEAKTKCINFDNVKDWYVKKQKIPSLASVDALYIDDENECIYFIEMKGWQEYVKYQPHDSVSIEKQTQEYNLKTKFKDSWDILTDFHRDGVMPSLTEAQKKQFITTPKRFILLTDVDRLLSSDPKNYIGAALGILSVSSDTINDIYRYTDEALEQVKPSGCLTVERKTCSEIDSYLAHP
jgi:hypothetical protein